MRFIILVFLMAGCEALLQVHTRLAGAILKLAVAEAAQKRDQHLREAEEAFSRAVEIDETLQRMTTHVPRPKAVKGAVKVAVKVPPLAAAVAPAAARADVQRIVAFSGEAYSPELEPLPTSFARESFAELYLLAWTPDAAETWRSAVTVRGGDESSAVLALPRAGAGADVIVALTSETHARQTAHVMAELEGWAMRALALPFAEAARLALEHEVTLGVILPEDE